MTTAGSRRHPRRPDAADLGFLGVTLALLFGGLWAAGWRLRVLVTTWSDARSYFVPKYEYAAARIAAGELPLWNPFELGGIPFLATIQPATFYPPVRLVTAIVSGDAAHVTLFFLHAALGAFGSLWLARELGLCRSAALFAALWLTQPTWLVRVFDNPAFIAGVTWIPYLLVLGRRLVQHPSARGAGLLALVAALQVTSGYPPLILASAYLVALGIPFWLLERRPLTRSGLARGLGCLLLAAWTASLLVAVQVLPTAELAIEAEREASATAQQAGMRELRPGLASIMNFPQPDARHAFAETWLRYGPVPIGLIVVGFLLGIRRPVAWYASAATILAAFVSGPGYTRLPLYGFVRLGLEWAYLAPFVVYLAAAVGLDAVLRLTRWSGPIAGTTMLAAAILTTAWGWQHVPRPLVPARSLEPLPLPSSAERLCDLRDPRYRAYWPRGQENGALLHARIASIGGYEESLPPTRSAALARILETGDAAVAQRWARHLARERNITARMGLRCVIARAAEPLQGVGFEMVEDAAGERVYIDPQALPRARLAHDAQWASGADEAAEMIRSAAPTTVVLEGAREAARPPCTPGADDFASIVIDRPEEVGIAVRTSCPAYLVLADTWYPGWTATIDGSPTQILRADFAFRAIALPAGRHEVRFVYAPSSVRIGALLSGIGLVVAGFLLLRREQDDVH